ncbi:hypothetical protein F2P81_022523 [Scophthalmus maximus]|uniref:Peptidase A2 domain-containing protein n=1 Tax=Scophthalmus maximus TaxID=52904 RepID=A0A6A4S2U1_SCOMX|nr:hypothetical protein F2P81_022523 [Scophthalmus maximus]
MVEEFQAERGEKQILQKEQEKVGASNQEDCPRYEVNILTVRQRPDHLRRELEKREITTNGSPDPKPMQNEVSEEIPTKQKDSSWERVKHFQGLRRPQRWEKSKDPAPSSTSYQEDSQRYEADRLTMKQRVNNLPTMTCQHGGIPTSPATEGRLTSNVQDVPDGHSFLGNCPRLEMVVNGVKIPFILDTGAKVTLLSHSLFRKSFKDIQMRDRTEIPWLKIKAANGLTVPYQGYVVLDFQAGDIEIMGKGVLIVKNDCFGTRYGLLGMNVILEIWKSVSSVDNLECELDNLQSLTNALPDPKPMETEEPEEIHTHASPDPKPMQKEVPEEIPTKQKDLTWKRIRHFLGLRKPQRWKKPKCSTAPATAGRLTADVKNVPSKPSFVGPYTMVEMVVNGVKIPFMLDTGSPVTLLNHSLFRKSFKDIQMRDKTEIPFRKVKAANGLKTPTQGYVVLDFQNGDFEFMGRAVLIVEDEDCCSTQYGVLGMNVVAEIFKPVSTLGKLLRDLDKLQSPTNVPPAPKPMVTEVQEEIPQKATDFNLEQNPTLSGSLTQQLTLLQHFPFCH